MKVVLLPGDGIGPEVVAEAARVLQAVVPDIELAEHAIGADAIERFGDPLPEATLEACRASDAILMGAVGAGDYAWSARNPEDGMFALRRELDVYANLRPSVAGGIDLMIVRELIGGLYFGARGTRPDGTVFDTCEYHPKQVERVVRKGFELARARSGRLTSVDKANVLATSRMWRGIAEEMAAEYPDVALDHLLVDTAAMRLVQDPGQFDVIVTENTFGDILSDIAAALTGGLGEAASACLGDQAPGLFEPVHGTAPDIAGRGIANPTATIRSAALLLEHGLRQPADAQRLNDALDRVAARGGTPDQGGTWTSTEVGDALVAELGSTEEVGGVGA
ncbi:MAG TPA: 3-isopropylmalate dehydrogenase [Baekduia sp.]|uniref:3-isopropylmalate dehydrogenase n=1 Tax=Baekduia sp. TaxID=2600305 RepID=UPI002C867954|nr:3-isopropylmalate dehydrogenase [Baekduia sp.]HMJ33515.1 3-isopropylmalate dehydrogenase [Baekduia sp.]